MIFALDTNILLDILIPNSKYLESSLSIITDISSNDELITCEIVYAELAAQFLSFSEINRFYHDTGIRLIPSNKEVLFEASCAWKNYLKYKKNKFICPHCGKSQDMTCNSCNRMIIARAHILSDFLIGSHAKILADKLISRDRGFYRAYFKNLQIVNPIP